MNSNDPHGLFLNKFGQRILGNSDAMDVDPSVTHCALEDYCICQNGKDCDNFMQCGGLNGFNVCKNLISVNLPTLNFPDLSNLTSILNVILG